MLIVGTSVVIAGRGRKLPVDAYIKTAKIEIISGEEERYHTAIAMLDSLFIHYGHHAEGLYWMGKINGDFIEKRASLKEKLPYLETMVAYIDSLHQCCENQDIKKKYRKKCETFTSEMDSIKEFYWRNYYNAGVEQVTEVEELMETVQQEEDSSSLAYYETRLEAQLDSCKDNMTLAIAIDPVDARPYIGLASAYEQAGDIETAVEWLIEALERAADRQELLSKIAYTYIGQNLYLEAIPFLKENIDIREADEQAMTDTAYAARIAGTMYNLSVCYSNSEQYDSAFAMYQRILVLDPLNVSVISSTGRYYTMKARTANDSASHYQSQGNEEQTTKWREAKDAMFDSARVFFKQAFELKQDNLLVCVEYGIVCALLLDNEGAAVAFTRATELDPGDADNWTSLGDAHLNLKDFTKAAQAYEKTVELKPDNKPVWETLKALYLELGNREKMAEADARIKSL